MQQSRVRATLSRNFVAQ